MGLLFRIRKSISSDGFINTIVRGIRAMMFRIRGRLFLGSGGRTCGPGFRLLGRNYLKLEGRVSFGFHCRVEAYDSYRSQAFTPEVRIGDSAHFGDYLHIGAIGRIKIGRNVLFGSRVLVIDHDHGVYRGGEQSDPATPPIERVLFNRGDIVIGNNVWVGDNAIIFGGADIGDGCVVAAGALVAGRIPAGSICVGNGRVVKEYDQGCMSWERI